MLAQLLEHVCERVGGRDREDIVVWCLGQRSVRTALLEPDGDVITRDDADRVTILDDRELVVATAEEELRDVLECL